MAAIAATLAEFAGDQLRSAIDITPGFVPVIDRHARLGLYVVLAAWPFALLAIAALVLGRRSGAPGPRVVAVLAAVAGVAALVTTVVAGHSGASAVWGHVTQ